MRTSFRVVALATALLPATLQAQQWLNAEPNPKTNKSIFRALDEWPSPNDFRDASGSPGTRYWQQRVDYVIKATLDTVTHGLRGSERVTYHNNSPQPLSYLWFQLDQNIEAKNSRANMTKAPLPTQMSAAARRFLLPENEEVGGYDIARVALVLPNGTTKPAKFIINGTQMRVNLDTPIPTGGQARVDIDWTFIVPEGGNNSRGVRELVKDGWIYEIAQWFPRAAVYDDVTGWQNDQFLGQGEFYLNFGNYDVSITVPHDHIVRSTGTLQNPLTVLTAQQRTRLTRAMAGDTAVFIVRPDEVQTPGSRPAGTAPLTWRFTAENVRDFAWASSKTYVWDAAGFRYKPGGRTIELHSVYPREAMPLWNEVSTKAIAQTMKTYGRLAFEYPYPQASNVNGSVGGMEYPMIAFCGGRPGPDGKYSKNQEYALASVTIHEVGHNWFPMIVATDERKWTWMDEGLNSFLEYYGSIEYDSAWPKARLRGPAPNIVNYMKDQDQVPLMTESDYIHRQFGNNGYSKPATGLVMLREKILGPERFDLAFQEYSKKWMFKHPQPADFFRTLASGSGEKLDYYWRGWFYSTYANDQAITKVESQNADSLAGNTKRGKFYNRVTIENKGGLVMPVELEIEYVDGSKERRALPVEVWRRNEKQTVHGFFSEKEILSVTADPDQGYADVDRTNNTIRKPVTPRPIS
jgi:Peptidase family M1 domain